MRVMSRAFRLHQNIEPIVVVDLRSMHLIDSSLRLVNNTSSRERPTTLSYHKLYTQCFTSRHHVITNKIHDLTTLCASCHERFDYIKTLHTSCRRSAIHVPQHFITSSRNLLHRHKTLHAYRSLIVSISLSH